MAYHAARSGGIIGAALWALLPCCSLAAPPQGTTTAATTTATAQTPSPPRHTLTTHRHPARIRHHAAATPSVAGTVKPPASPAPDRGYVPAPVVPQPPAVTDANANLLPPQTGVPTTTQFEPGTMQLHYPFSGNGYVTGSSPQAMDDATTAKIPGVMMKMPIQPPTPQPLPPP